MKKNGIVLCTGGSDKIIRVWNFELNLLRTIDSLMTNINAFCFTKNFLIAGGGENFLLMVNLCKINDPMHDSNTSRIKSKKCVDVIARGSRNIIITVTNHSNCSEINTIDLSKKR